MVPAAQLLPVALVAIALVVPLAKADTWVHSGKSPEGETYLDVDNLNIRTNPPTYWSRSKYFQSKQEQSRSGSYDEQRTQYEVDCDGAKGRPVAGVRFLDGNFTWKTNIPGSWSPYTPGTAGAAATQVLCLLAEFNVSQVDLGAFGWDKDKEFTSTTGSISVDSSRLVYSKGRLIARMTIAYFQMRSVSTTDSTQYRRGVEYGLFDCKAATYRYFLRNWIDDSGKSVWNVAVPPNGAQQELRVPAQKQFLLDACSSLEAKATLVVAPRPSATSAAAAPQKASVPSSGSGFVIATDGYIVTNNHVVADCGEIEVRLPHSGERAKAMVRWSDQRNDIAVIKVDRTLPSVARLRQTPLKAGDSVIAYGFPLSGLLTSEGTVSGGMVAAAAGIGDDTTRLQISAPVQPGNSGGPLLDETGAVGGVVVSKLNAARMLAATGDIPQNINFAVKGEVVRLLLDTFGAQYTVSKSAAKLSSRQIAEKAKGFSVHIACK